MHVPLTLGRRRALLPLITVLTLLVAACAQQPAAAPATAPTTAPAEPAATGVAAPTTAPAAAATTAPAAAPTTAPAAAPTTAAEAAPTTAAAAAPSGEPILLGASAPLTGDNASNGFEAVSAAKLAAKEWNARGGVLGLPLQIVEGDDRCDPKEGATVAQRFVAQGVIAAPSHYCSGVALAAIPIFEEANILYADFGAVSSKIPAFGYDKYFSTIYNGEQPGVFSANFAIDQLGKTKLAMVDDRTPANGEFAAAFKRTAEERGAEFVLEEHVTQGDKDFSAFVTRLKGSGAEVLYMSLYFPEGGLLTRQIRDQQVPIEIVSTDSGMDPQYLQIAGADAAEGVYAVTQPLATELESAREFVERYQQEYPDRTPGYIAPYAYDAVNVIATAYTAVGAVDNDAAAEWLHGRTADDPVQGVTGPLYWNEDGTLTQFNFSVYQAKSGKMQFVPTS